MLKRSVERRSLPGWRSSTAPAARAPQSLSSGRRSPIRCSAPGPKGENLERTTREAFSRTLGDESGRGNGHPHIDARVLDMARLIVTKIEEDPTRFQIAYENLARERQRWGTLTRARQEWLEILKQPWPEIRAILLDDSDEGQRLRSSHPFTGLIGEAERYQITARHPPPGAPPDWKPPPPPAPDVLARLLADEPLPR